MSEAVVADVQTPTRRFRTVLTLYTLQDDRLRARVKSVGFSRNVEPQITSGRSRYSVFSLDVNP